MNEDAESTAHPKVTLHIGGTLTQNHSFDFRFNAFDLRLRLTFQRFSVFSD
jgi:hypothetical protein